MTDPLVSRLRELEAKATPAPWRFTDEGRIDSDARYICDLWGYPHEDPNCEFIVSLRNSLDSLLARIEAGERLAEVASAILPLEESCQHGLDDEQRAGLAKRDALRAALKDFEKAKEEK